MMSVYRFPLLVLVLYTFINRTFGNGKCENKLVTFNTGLTKTIPKTGERKNELIRKLRDMDSDIVCLQEVFYGKDVREIVNGVFDTFPFSYSPLHKDDGRLGYPYWFSRPCPLRTITTFWCIFRNCNMSQPLPNVFACGMQKCNVWQKMNQECVSCVVVTGIGNAIKQCVLTSKTEMNIPGLLFLSKRPLRQRKVVPFIPDKKQLLPRSMLVTNVERFGNVSCTHLTAGLGPIYSEPELQGMFSSWEKQNAYDAQFVIDYFKDGNTVVMGDLNTGPKIEDRGITAELGGSYDLLVANGYTSPYVTLVGKGTYNDENPFTSSGPHDKIIDHVLLKKGFKAVSAKRVLDEDYVLVGGPLSDHYGVEVSVVQDDDTGPDTPA